MKDIKEKHMSKLREELAEEIEELKRDQQAKADIQHMTPERFEILREEFLTHEARILDWKRGEYSPNEDRLLNFRLQVVGKAGGEAWYFGDWQNSKGCLREMETAKKLGIPLREGMEAK